MLQVYIADDEEVVREGLKTIIDWTAINFTICGEAGDGETALTDILRLQPDLVLLDIRMPKLHGLELAAQARQKGFNGKIIILSGYSEFKYAQDAIRCNVDFYLNKPIDEDELFEAVKSIHNAIQKEKLHSQHIVYYREKAKHRILQDMIQLPTEGKNKNLASINVNLTDLNLEADVYQIIILVNTSTSEMDVYHEFCKLLKIPKNSTIDIEHFILHETDVVFIKGKAMLKRFNEKVTTYMNDAPFNAQIPFFIAAGQVVTDMNEIYFSYHGALAIKEHRFFGSPAQKIFLYNQLPKELDLTLTLTSEDSKAYATKIYQTLLSNNAVSRSEIMLNLKSDLLKSSDSVEYIKAFLSGLYLQIKFMVQQDYPTKELSFKNNSETINFIHSRNYLSEILDYFSEYFEDIIGMIRIDSNDRILDDLINYIQNNYQKNLKLATLSELFGYNSSYLGKLLTKKLGQNFNAYLDAVRVEKAKELLTNEELKIYEISERVGYKNVNDFHKKFKSLSCCSPSEYRNKP